MNRIKSYLLASVFCGLPFAASAADLAVKAPPPAVAPPVPFTWTGFYVGGSAGFIGQSTVATDLDSFHILNDGQPGDTYGVPGTGGLFGIDVGYNYQSGNWVVGIEADIAFSTLNNTTTSIGFDGCRFAFNSKLSSLGTVRGRIGYAFDRTLVYATGGLAYGRVQNQMTVGVGSGSIPVPADNATSTKTKTGWTAGGGIEYAMTNNWTVRVEALYVDLGTNTTANADTCGCRFSFKNTYTIGRAGLNYKF